MAKSRLRARLAFLASQRAATVPGRPVLSDRCRNRSFCFPPKLLGAACSPIQQLSIKPSCVEIGSHLHTRQRVKERSYQPENSLASVTEIVLHH